MDPLNIIRKYYAENSTLYNTLLTHSRAVTEKAIAIATKHPTMHPNLDFIREAAMLHDVGIFLTDAPDIGCFGNMPYICHGYLGHDLLLQEGFPQHALVCERHTGMGISLQTIIQKHLPLPHRNLLPVSIEEQIICFADKFFSKTNLYEEKTPEHIRITLSKDGKEQVEQFDSLCKRFL